MTATLSNRQDDTMAMVHIIIIAFLLLTAGIFKACGYDAWLLTLLVAMSTVAIKMARDDCRCLRTRSPQMT